MKHDYRITTNWNNRPQLVGKGRLLKSKTVLEAMDRLEQAAAKLVKEACWYPYCTPVNSLRVPLLELRLLRRKLK